VRRSVEVFKKFFDHALSFNAREYLDRTAAVLAGFIGDIPVPDRDGQPAIAPIGSPADWSVSILNSRSNRCAHVEET